MNNSTTPDITTSGTTATDAAASGGPRRLVARLETEATFLAVIGELDLVDSWNGRVIAWLTEIDRLRAHGHRIDLGGGS